MAGVRIATGYIEISAETSKVPQQIQDALNKAGGDTAKKAGTQIGKDLGAGVQTGLQQAPTTSGASPSILSDAIQGKTTIGSHVRAHGQRIGKELGKAINEGVQQGSTTGKKTDEIIVGQAKPKETGKKIGKEVNEGINESMQDGKGPIDILKDGIKDFGNQVKDELKKGDVKGAFGDVGDVVANTTSAIKNAGEVIGVHLDSVEKFGTDVANTLDRLGSTVQPVATSLIDTSVSLKDAFAALKTGDAAGTIKSVQDALKGAEPVAKLLGVNLSGASHALNQVNDAVGRFTSTKKDFTDTIEQFKGLGAKPDKLIAMLGDFAAPVAMAEVTSQITPGYRQQVESIQAQLRGQQPVDPMAWFRTMMPGLMGPGIGTPLSALPSILPKEYEWLRQRTQGPQRPSWLPSWVPELPQIPSWVPPQLGGPPPPPPATVGHPELGPEVGGPVKGPAEAPRPGFQYWGGTREAWSPTRPAATAAAPSAVSTAHMSVSAGSVIVSGASVSSSGGGPTSLTPSGHTPRQTGGSIDKDEYSKLHAGEHVLTADDVNALGGQDAVRGMRDALHSPTGGAPAADKGAALGDTGSDRTGGFIPSGAGSKAVAGTSFVAGLLNLGNEAVAGLIDTGASAAQMAASAAATAGTMGAGAAAGPAAGIGIQIAAGEAKRAVSYGFQMASILADAGIEQLFGMFGGPPRWLGYDYSQFVPSLDWGQIGTTTVEKAMQQQQGKGGGPGQQPGGPVTPEHLPGEQPVGPPVPKFGQPAAPLTLGGAGPSGAPGGGPPGAQGDVQAGIQAGLGGQGAPPPTPPPTATAAQGAGGIQGGANPMNPFAMLGIADEGGVLNDNGFIANTSGRPELVLSPQQMDALGPLLGIGANPYNRSGDTYHITAVDAQDVAKEIDKRKRLAMMQYSGRP